MKLDWKTCFRLGVSAFLLFLCVHHWEAFAHFLRVLFGTASPLLTGAVMAYIVNIPMSFYERHYFPNSQKTLAARSRRPVCMLLAFLSIAAVVLLVLRLVIPEVGKCVTLLLASVPPMLENLADALLKSSLLTDNLAQFLQEVDWRSVLTNAIEFVKNGVGTMADWAVALLTGLISGVANFFVGLIFSIYLLASKERLGRQLQAMANRYVRASWRKKGAYVLDVANDSFHRYFVGQCTEAVILGCLCAGGMLLFRFPYAAVVGATVGLTALIPVAGAYIGGAVGFLLILPLSPLKAILFVVYLVVLQQLEGNIIYPKVVGSSLGLPGIWVLAAVIIGGGLGGILGMILSVPLTSCIYRLIREDVLKHQKDGESGTDLPANRPVS